MTRVMTQPDLESLALWLATDLDGAFASYVRATADGVYSGALRMVGHRQDAEDILQETYARAYRALSGYGRRRIEELQIRGWTWTIAANLCRNRIRSRARKPTTSLDEDRGLGHQAPDASDSSTDLDPTLQAALLTLTFPQRAGVVMRHVLDLPYEEIARALGRPVGTVKNDVHRGLARLRQIRPPEVTP